MSAILGLARPYVEPPDPGYWCWANDGRVVTWLDGTTIAFREEIVEILGELAPVGLPPFGPLVLLFAMCRERWWQTDTMRALAPILRDSAEGPGRPSEDVLAALRPEFGDPRIRAALIAAAAERMEPRHTGPEAAAVVEELERVPQTTRFRPHSGTATPVGWHNDVIALDHAVTQLDPETVGQRARTGLEGELSPAELDLQDAGGARRLIELLDEDSEHAGLARVARDLLALLHLPRPVSSREELPLGGLSDLAHRGPLHRLLTSELAHDEGTLAARLATGEALFLKREAPPHHPPSARAILVDCGIRMWGLPRVYAAAAALALAANTEGRTRVGASRSAGPGIEPVDLARREGLVQLLEALEPEPHPADALEAFGRAVEVSDEVALITSPAVLADPAFAPRLAAWARRRPLYAVALEGDGTLELYEYGARGRRRLQRVELELDRLLARRPGGRRASATLVGAGGDPELPAALRRRPFPLLLPIQVDPRRARVITGYGLLALTRRRRLIHRPDPLHGGTELDASIHSGELLDFHAGEDGCAYLVFRAGDGGQLATLIVDLRTNECRQVRCGFGRDALLGSCVRWGMLLVFLQHAVKWFELETGGRLGSLRYPAELEWHGGRILRHHLDGSFWFVGYDGRRPAFERIPDQPGGEGLRYCFERPGLEGFYYIGFEGRPAREREYAIPSRSRLVFEGLSIDDSHALFRDLDSELGRVLDLESGELTRQYGKDLRAWRMRSDRAHFSSQPAVHRRLRAAGVHLELGLLLYRRRHVVRLFAGPTGWSVDTGLPLVPLVSWTGVRWRAFEKDQHRPRRHLGLRVAEWEDGSRAWLDPHGVVHLRSSDSAVPELSLILSDGHASGWLAGGGVFGAPFFCGDAPRADPAAVARALDAFARRLS